MMQLPPLDRPMYLYLSQPEWAHTWVNGGRIPISPASTYKVDFRHQTLTPDEVDLKVSSGFMYDPYIKDLNAEKFASDIADSLGFKGINILGDNISYDDGNRSVILSGSIYNDERDNHILSFSRFLRADLAKKLGKFAVVEIPKPIELFNHISSQMKSSGTFEFVEYTSGVQRNTFLKSKEDAWQNELRMAWPIIDSAETETIWVEIYPGAAESIELNNLVDNSSLDELPFLDFDRREEYEIALFERIQYMATKRHSGNH